MAERTSRRRRSRARIAALGGVVVLAFAGGGMAVAAAQKGGAERYRTATAERAAVEQTLAVTGTVASAGRRDLAFSVAGTVASVDVAVGQVLAALDTEALQETVDEAEQQLADAERQLEDDLDSQRSSTATSTSATSTSATGTTGGTGSTDGTGGTGASGATGGATDGASGADDPALVAAVAAVAAAQRALLAAQTTAVDAVSASRATLAEATDVACVGVLDPQTADLTDLTDPQALPTADVPTSEQLLACRDALAGVLAAQEAVADAQDQVSTLAAVLDAAVSDAQEAWRAAQASTGSGAGADPAGATTGTGATGASGTVTPGSSTTATTGTTTAASTATGGLGGTSAVATAADVLADQAAIEAAEAQVAIAADALARDQLTTPVPGTVAAVALAVGDSVSPSSTTAVVTVLGDGGYVVETAVALSQVDELAVGQAVTATVSATDPPLTGTVSSIGVLAASSTSSEPSYPVVIALDPVDTWLWEGSSADVVVELGASAATLTVPTSAVHVSAGVATVQVLDGDEVSDVEVTVGTVGTELTEVVEGLVEGEEVVLADLDEPMVADESTDSGLTGLGSESESQAPTFQGGFPPPAGGGMAPTG